MYRCFLDLAPNALHSLCLTRHLVYYLSYSLDVLIFSIYIVDFAVCFSDTVIKHHNLELVAVGEVSI